MDIVIKRMETDEEKRGKAFVHFQAWKEAYVGMIDQDYLDGLTLEKCEKVAFLWPDNIFIAKDGDRVVGFAGYGNCRDEGLEDAGEIFAIYILSEYYGRGVGRRLMETGLEQLTSCAKVAVHVLKDNQRAIRFYERFGFRADGTEKTLLLGSPVTEIRMVKDNRSAESEKDNGI